MTEKVMLDLPDEVAQQAHTAASRTGRAFEQVLTDWISQGAAQDVESLLVPGAEYPIYTPVGNEAAAPVLLETLRAHQATRDQHG